MKKFSEKESDTTGSVKPDKPPARKNDFFCATDLFCRAVKIILFGLFAVNDGLFHSWIGRSFTIFHFRQKGIVKQGLFVKASSGISPLLYAFTEKFANKVKNRRVLF